MMPSKEEMHEVIASAREIAATSDDTPLRRWARVIVALADENAIAENDHSLSTLVGMIYEDSAVGCCLHIAVDDGNLDDDDIDFCIFEARRRGHSICEKAATMLRAMNEEDRVPSAWQPPRPSDA